MYLRNVKQFIKNSSPTFDEHRYGFHSFLEAVRSAQRAGLFRLERNRQGILRVFPGNQMPQTQRSVGPYAEDQQMVQQSVKPYDVEDDITLKPIVDPEPPSPAGPEETAASEAQPEMESIPVESAPPVEESTSEKPVRKRRISHGIKRKTVTPRKATNTAAKRPRKKAVPPSEEGSAT
jgi:hypothetical protein